MKEVKTIPTEIVAPSEASTSNVYVAIHDDIPFLLVYYYYNVKDKQGGWMFSRMDRSDYGHTGTHATQEGAILAALALSNTRVYEFPTLVEAIKFCL